MDKNTIEDPLKDGGGAKVVEGMRDGVVSYYCANAPESIFNEGGCILSTESNVCREYDSAILDSLHLTESTLVGLHGVTGRYVYAIDGLVFDETNTPGADNPSAIVSLPCTFKGISRWVPTEDSEVDCISAVSVESTTLASFATWIYASNDLNPNLKDVYFRGECHPDDVDKVGMMVYVSAEEKCYRNVHPDHL
jgi:hypothetical protein